MSILKLELACTKEALDQAADMVGQCLAEALADETQQDLYLLAFVEALNNAAEHGCQWSLAQSISVAGHFGPGLAVLFVADQGPGFTPKFPDLRQVRGKRGRGLGFIKKFTDGVVFNTAGNQIVFWKGCLSMIKKLKFSTAKVVALPGDVLVVSEFSPRGNVFDAMGELLDSIHRLGWQRLFLNLAEVKLINSSAWGSIFAEAGRENVDLLVLFNCAPPLMEAAEAMGIKARQDAYAKIVVSPDCQEPFALLCQCLEGASRP